MADIYHYDKKREQTMIKTDTGKRKKEQFVVDLRESDVVNEFFAVKLKRSPRSYKKGFWFDFIATDKTGDIGVKFWGGDNKDRVKRLYDSFQIGDVVQVRSGKVEVYEDTLQISVNETAGGLRRCSPDEYDVTDFIPSLEEERIAELFAVIKKELKEIKQEPLQQVLALFFDDPKFVEEYMHAPSAISHHHNYVGGNLEHTVGVIKLCKTIGAMYTSANMELVITGAILHDIGKLKEYQYKAAIDKSDEGNFIGHIVIGDRWLREKIKEIRDKGNQFSPELEHHLTHILLSHHGRYEWGSPKMPKTIEACVVHQADLMDSQVKNFIQTIEEGKKTTEDDWLSIYDSDVGKRRLMYLGDRE